MKGKLYIFADSGEVTTQEITSPPNLDTLQKAVGGPIQVVPLFETFKPAGEENSVPCVAFCDDEGKLKRRPLNVLATTHWMRAAREYSNDPNAKFSDYIVGNLVVITGDSELLAEL